MDVLIIGDKSAFTFEKSGTILYYERAEDEIRRHVRHNEDMFCVRCGIFNYGYYIMKNSKEGLVLQTLLKDEEEQPEDIIRYIDEVAFKNLNFPQIITILEKEKETAFKKGQMDIKHKLNELLRV